MIGIYLRLSLADEDTGTDKKESNSIQNQRELIAQYLRLHEDLSGAENMEFVDDGYSGKNMEDRPAFQRMLAFIRQGSIRTVIVKDLSRFARNYIEAGDYLERIFPMLGVRFISVNDGLDTDSIENSDRSSFETAFRNILNASYSKDLSKKISSGDRTLQMKAMYLGGTRPFGYLPDPDDVHNLMIDPVAAKYVREIFTLAGKGYGTGDIAKLLNFKKIPTPGAYQVTTDKVKITPNTEKLKNSVWKNYTVGTILKNEKYKGTYVARRHKQAAPLSKKIIKNDDEKIIRIEHAQPAIVTEEEFALAQKVLIKQKGLQGKRRRSHHYPLKGKVVCGFCQRSMSYGNQLRAGEYFYCRNSEADTEALCRGVKIPLDPVVRMVKESLLVQLQNVEKAARYLERFQRDILEQRTKLDLREDKLEEDLQGLADQKIRLFSEYADRKIPAETFVREKKEIGARETKIREELKSIDVMKQDLVKQVPESAEDLKDLSKKAGGYDHLGFEITEELLDEFLEKVVIYSDTCIEIHWKFEDAIRFALEKETSEKP